MTTGAEVVKGARRYLATTFPLKLALDCPPRFSITKKECVAENVAAIEVQGAIGAKYLSTTAVAGFIMICVVAFVFVARRMLPPRSESRPRAAAGLRRIADSWRWLVARLVLTKFEHPRFRATAPSAPHPTPVPLSESLLNNYLLLAFAQF